MPKIESSPSTPTDDAWGERICLALGEGHFELWFQPIHRAATGEVVHNEVLLRLRDQTGELIVPSAFLPTAERTGLVRAIDRHVVKAAIDRLGTEPALRLSVNLSGQTIAETGFAAFVQQALSQTAVEAHRLGFEVNEAALDRPEAVRFVAEVRSLGCPVALDDFGVGASAFARLRELPADIVKIDGRFVRNLESDPVNRAVVKAINDVAHALGKRTIAESVENAAALQVLRRIGVDWVQGYHLGKPSGQIGRTQMASTVALVLSRLAAVGIGAYLLKSTLGIDLIEGFHTWELPIQLIKAVVPIP